MDQGIPRIDVKDILSKAYYGVVVNKRSATRYGIRVQPYIEVYSRDLEFLEQLHMELLRKSVSSVVRPKFLRIQGIQNCLILKDFCPVSERWWKDCLDLFEKGAHLNPNGIFRIVKIRDARVDSKPMSNKITLAEVVRTVLSR